MRQRNYRRRAVPWQAPLRDELSGIDGKAQSGPEIPNFSQGTFSSIKRKLSGLGLPDHMIKKIMSKANAGYYARKSIDSNIEIMVFACGAETTASMICEKPGLVFMKPQLLARALDFPVDKALAIASGMLRSGYAYHERSAIAENRHNSASRHAIAAFSPAQEETKQESIKEWKARRKEENSREIISGLNIGQVLLDKVMESLKKLQFYDALTVHRNLGLLLSSGAAREELSGLIEKIPGILTSSSKDVQNECARLSVKRTVTYLEKRITEMFCVTIKLDLLEEAAAICKNEKGADALISILSDMKVFADEYSMKPDDFNRLIRENIVRLANNNQSDALDVLMDEISKIKAEERSMEKNGKNGKQDIKTDLNAHIENAMRFILSVGFRLQTAKAAVENQYFRLEVVHNNTHYRKPGWAEGMNQRIFERILKVAWSQLVKAGAIRFHKQGTCAGVRMASQVRDEKVAALIREEMHLDRNGEYESA